MSDDLAHGPDEDTPSCRACGHPADQGVVAAYACPNCGERNPYAPPKAEGEPSGPFDGGTFGREIEEGRERLKEIQREANFDPMSDEPGEPDAMWRYIELLEAAVVGQHAAARVITKGLKP
jgi:hypothetical protein